MNLKEILAEKDKEKPQTVFSTLDILNKIMPSKNFLPGEDAQQYETFQQEFIEAVKPNGLQDYILTKDYIDYTWEEMRLQKLKVSTIYVARRQAVEKLLFTCLLNGKRPYSEAETLSRVLADAWIAGKEPDKETADEILSGYGYTEADVQAICYAIKSPELESLDKNINSTAHRRHQSLRMIENRKEVLAKRAREHSEEIISEAEFVEEAP